MGTIISAIIGAVGSTGFDAETDTVGGKLELYEGTDNGTSKVTMQSPAALTADRAITVPDADVDLTDIATNSAHVAGDGSDHADVAANTAAAALNTAHSTGDGSDHADVATNTADIAAAVSSTTGGAGNVGKLLEADAGGKLDGYSATEWGAHAAHVAGDGSDHADVATNSAHVAGDGSDHADVAANTAAIAAATTDTGVGVGNAGKLVELDGSGQLDGRDVGADGTKLDGIEALADVTDQTNVTTALGVTDAAAVDESTGAPDDGKLLKLNGAGRLDVSFMPPEAYNTAIVAVNTAEMLALHTTPKELVAAPGAGYYLEMISCIPVANFNTVALDDATSQGNLRIKYGTSGTTIAVQEAAGFVDVASGTEQRHVRPNPPGATQDFTPSNEAIVLDNDGGAFTDPGSADPDYAFAVRYRIHELA